MRRSSSPSNSVLVVSRAGLHELDERVTARGDEVADLVEQVAVVVPAQDERVQVDDLVPAAPRGDSSIRDRSVSKVW